MSDLFEPYKTMLEAFDSVFERVSTDVRAEDLQFNVVADSPVPYLLPDTDTIWIYPNSLETIKETFGCEAKTEQFGITIEFAVFEQNAKRRIERVMKVMALLQRLFGETTNDSIIGGKADIKITKAGTYPSWTYKEDFSPCAVGWMQIEITFGV